MSSFAGRRPAGVDDRERAVLDELTGGRRHVFQAAMEVAETKSGPVASINFVMQFRVTLHGATSTGAPATCTTA